MLKLQIGQAKRSEKIASAPPRAASAALSLPSMGATLATPSASFRAVSKDSARRCLMSSRTLKRSTTTSMVCFLRRSSLGGSSSSQISPSIRART